MYEPCQDDEEPSVEGLSKEIPHGVTESTSAYDGGGGGPGKPTMMKDARGLWVIFAIGSILIAISLAALSRDPGVWTYCQLYPFSFLQWRVFFELLLLIVGCGCFFVSLTCLMARSQARKLEKGSDGRVKSLRAKRQEKISDASIFGIIGEYIGALLNHI